MNKWLAVAVLGIALAGCSSVPDDWSNMTQTEIQSWQASGFTAEVAARMETLRDEGEKGHSGIGTTLSANAMALVAMRACLTEVMTPAAYAHMLPLAAKLAQQLQEVIVLVD